MVAATVWRVALGTQLGLALAIALAIHPLARPQDAPMALIVAATVFLAIQYVVSSLPALIYRRPGEKESSLADALRCAATEPVYFAVAELAMTRGAAVPAPVAREGERPLLLVHGFACNSRMWCALRPRLSAAGFAPIDAVELSPVTADLDSLSAALASRITDFHRAQRSPITILAHSMGGLVCRKALEAIDASIVRRLVTIATPHHGAAIANALARRPLTQLRPGSAWLAGLNEEQEGRLPVPVTSLWSDTDQFVIPRSSARLAGAHNHTLGGLGHFGLVMSARAADVVLRALREDHESA